MRLSQTAIVETTTKYNTSEYFTSRQEIANSMKTRIQERMDLFTYSKIVEFNLRHLSFDSDVTIFNDFIIFVIFLSMKLQ